MDGIIRCQVIQAGKIETNCNGQAMSLEVKYLIAWFPMLLIAIGNGMLRESFIKKYVSDFRARQLSTLTLLLFFTVYIYFMVRQFPPQTGNQALLLGIIWVVLTLLFEFGFGRFRGNSWQSLLAEYNIFKGKVWILIPAWVMIAPWLFYQLQK
jgi:hypothetical protein